MTQEQYERATHVKIEIENLEKVKSLLGQNARVQIVVAGVNYTELNDAGLNSLVGDYVERRIAELEKEFEEL